MSSRQAKHQARQRAEWTAAGRCHDCGAECDGYRCGPCNAPRAQAGARRRERRRVISQEPGISHGPVE